MTQITPFITTFRVADENGIISVEFKTFLDQIFARIGGVTGGVYNQLSDGANVIWNVDQSPNAVIVLGGNRTINNPANMVPGLLYRLTLVQDATGNRTVTWGSAYKWPAGIAPTLSTAANAVDELWFTTDGTNMKGCVFAKDIR